VGRSAGLLTIVISLVCSAVLFAGQWGGGGPAAGGAGRSSALERANAAAASVAAFQADRELQAYQLEHGTFAGALVNDISSVTVLRADAAGYCLKVVTSGVARYEAGPGGALTAQPCA
jgi:hypothetical protein